MSVRTLSLTAATLICSASALLAQAPTQKQVPLPGVAIPDNDRTELTASVAALGKEIAELRNKPNAAALLPDLEIFHKAVDYALRYNEFMKADQTNAAKA